MSLVEEEKVLLRLLLLLYDVYFVSLGSYFDSKEGESCLS